MKSFCRVLGLCFLLGQPLGLLPGILASCGGETPNHLGLIWSPPARPILPQPTFLLRPISSGGAGPPIPTEKRGCKLHRLPAFQGRRGQPCFYSPGALRTHFAPSLGETLKPGRAFADSLSTHTPSGANGLADVSVQEMGRGGRRSCSLTPGVVELLRGVVQA